MRDPPTPALARPAKILIWLLAALTALFMVWPVWRAFLPLEIWGNEGWNAYHADAAMRGAGLYPPPDGLVANNYPPISYYLNGWLGRVIGDALYAGRALSILSTLGLGAGAAVIVRQFGGTRAAALVAGLWLTATLARFFDFYVGMNEPQLLAHAVMAAALVWFLKRHAQGRAVEPAVLAMVFAGFIKHNIIVVPAVALIWLACDNWRLALRAAFVGAAAAALGLALCAMIYAPHFTADMLMPRSYHLDRALHAIGRIQFVLPALILGAVWAWIARDTRAARFTALMIGVALASYFLQKSGAGVDENAQFELVFATAIAVGLAFDGLQRDPLRTGWRAGAIQALVLAVLLVRLLASTRIEFFYVLASPQYRALATEHAGITRAEATRVAAIPGPVGCSNLVVCRMAKKPFVYDHFKVQQMVETGLFTWQAVHALTIRNAIKLDEIDPRANVTSIWRRLRSD